MLDEPTWNIAMASAAEVIRAYAVMMENGEIQTLRAPLALLRIARVIEETPLRTEVDWTPPDRHMGD